MSSFISNFEKTVLLLLEKFQHWDKWHMIGFVLFAILLIAAFYLARRLRSPWRHLVMVLLFIQTIRLFAFENPLSWKFFQVALGPEDVGWRQAGTIPNELARFYDYSDGVTYLAIGSSQVGAIFAQYRNKHTNLNTYSLAGMNVLSIYLHRHRVVKKNPKNIILYLSEMDLFRIPTLEGAKLDPSPGWQWPEFYRKITLSYLWPDVRFPLREMMFNDLFPEYKYGFVFRGLVDKLLSRRELLNEPDATQVVRDADFVKHSLQIMRVVLEEEEHVIQLNLSFLNDFLEFCDSLHIPVYILEGEYHPGAYSDKNIRLNARVRGHLEKLAERNPHTYFIPRGTFFQFTEDDYRDGSHVHKDSGERYTEALMAYLRTHRL